MSSIPKLHELLGLPEGFKNVDIQEWLKVPRYLRELRNIMMAANWTLCLHAIYATTNIIEKLPIRVNTIVPAGGSYTLEVNLVGTKWCCLCYWCKFAAKLEDEVLLTIHVNEEPNVDVPSKWRNKTPFVEEPCPAHFQSPPRYYIEIPKRKFRLIAENEASSDSRFAFYTNYDRCDFNQYGKPLAEWWAKDIGECIKEVLLHREKEWMPEKAL